jgi:hypothetical protein
MKTITAKTKPKGKTTVCSIVSGDPNGGGVVVNVGKTTLLWKGLVSG